MYSITKIEREIGRILLRLFTIEGRSADQVLTEGELDIFNLIVFRKNNRAQVICSTQYGKSLTIALACIIVSCLQGELIAVIAPTDKKSKIIMHYFIEHLGDDASFTDELEKNTKLERLRMEESKDRIILRNGGGIYTLSANVSSGTKAIEGAMGEGAKIVIQDESCLIPDNVESSIFRMIAGKADAFYCKVGNPFYSNHFKKSWDDPNYEKIFIDYEQALREGRYTQEFINEARHKPNFDILFGCKFPPDTAVDTKGFQRLLSDEDIEKAQEEVEPFGEQRLGVDVAEGGGNSNVLVSRWANFAKIVLKYKTEDTMDVAAKVAGYYKEFNLLDQNIFVDSIGVGKGVYDRLIESRFKVAECKGSEKADDPVQFINKRAENYWRLRTWIKQGGKLEPSSDWNQLKNIKYKADISSRMLIMSKDEMMREGIESPDVADSLAMTFSRKSVLNPKANEDRETFKQFDSQQHKQKKSLGARYSFN